jgi:hypothetical protein
MIGETTRRGNAFDELAGNGITGGSARDVEELENYVVAQLPITPAGPTAILTRRERHAFNRGTVSEQQPFPGY